MRQAGVLIVETWNETVRLQQMQAWLAPFGAF